MSAPLEERVAALEAELAALVAARAQGRSVVAAEIVDEQGRTRAMLSTGHGGTVSLNLLDAAGRLRAALGQDPGGPTLSLFDENALRRLDLRVTTGDVPQLVLHDETGARRIDASIDAHGAASVGVLGADGSPRAVMLVMATGRGVIGASR